MPIQGKQCIQGNFKDLDSVCDDNECVEIVAPSVLNFISYADLGAFLQMYVKKMRKGGVLKLGGSSLSHVLTNKNDVDEMNKLLYNDQLVKQGIYTPSFISEKLSEFGLRITRKSILEDNMFIVEAIRV